MSALEQAQEHLDNQAKGFEAFNQRILRTVLIEERRRYCYLVDNYISGEAAARRDFTHLRISRALVSGGGHTHLTRPA